MILINMFDLGFLLVCKTWLFFHFFSMNYFRNLFNHKMSEYPKGGWIPANESFDKDDGGSFPPPKRPAEQDSLLGDPEQTDAAAMKPMPLGPFNEGGYNAFCRF